MVEVNVNDGVEDTHIVVFQPQDIEDLTKNSAVFNLSTKTNKLKVFFYDGTRDEILQRFSESGILNHPK